MTSCSKEQKVIEFSDCIADPVIYDSVSIVAKLTGTWVIIKQRCGWVGDTDTPTQNVKRTLNSDHSFTETKNGQIVLQGTWYIDRYYASSATWQLNIRSQNTVYNYDWGAIKFCGGNLIIDGSPNDGCLTYYYRTN